MIKGSLMKVPRQNDEERTVYSTNSVGYPHAREWSWTLYPITYTKFNSRRIKDLNIRPKTGKLGENIGKTLQNIGFDNDFLEYNTTSTGIKQK